MFNSVQFVRDLCQKKQVPISQLEKACGFSNGYLNPKKMERLPYDRALRIAEYLEVPVTLILTGTDGNKKAPAETGKRITDEDIKFALFGGGDVEITDAMYDEVRNFAAYVKEREQKKKE